MDFHALQNKLFEMDPTDPREDLAKLQQVAKNGGNVEAPPTKDYLNESVQVAEGSMPLGLDSIADFAALAGVSLNESQKTGSAGQLKGKDAFKTNTPSTTGEQPHPARNKLVGEDETDLMRGIQRTRNDVSDESSVSMVKLALENAVDGKVLTPQQRDALSPYVDALIKILSEPRFATVFDNIVKMANKDDEPKEGFASDAQRKAAFASGYKPKDKKKSKKESMSIKDTLMAQLEAYERKG
jgi:hypothetical protein